MWTKDVAARLWLAGMLLGWLAAAPAWSQAPAAPTADRWEPTIQKFEQADDANPPTPGGNLFVGSSSVRLWPLDEAFPDQPCLNRGFGGSQLPDVLRYVDRIVLPYAPRVIVLYCGDNDLANKRTPVQVRDDYREFVRRVRERLPETRIVWVAIKPSGKRWALRETIQQANALVRQAQEGRANEVFVDVWPPMLDSDGQPRRELFVEDQLHLSPAGYAVWNRLVEPHLVSAASAGR